MTVKQAIEQLSQSDRGKAAMRGVAGMLDTGLAGLDSRNRRALIALLDRCWVSPMTTRQRIRLAIDREN